MAIPQANIEHVSSGGRRRWLFRSLATLAGVTLGLVTLWSGGFDAGTLHRLLHLYSPDERQSVHVLPERSKVAPPRADSTLNIPRVGAPPKRLPGADASIAKEPSRLYLTGTVLGRNVHEGYAMLGVSADNPQTFGAGALLLNGARLTEIHEKYVVLERGGRSARLYLRSTRQALDAASGDNPLLMVGGPQTVTPATSP